MTQTITLGNTGADSRRVLEALTPLTGIVAPAANAAFLGQVYIDTVAGDVYSSVATDSVSPADDWVKVYVGTPVTPDPTVVTGTAAPAVNADFVGQLFVDTSAKNVYVAVDTDSVSPADDWVEVTPTT